MRIAHGLERRRVFLILFGEDVLGGEPALQPNVFQDRKRVGAHPGQQDGHAVRGLFTKEVLETLDADDVGVAHARLSRRITNLTSSASIRPLSATRWRSNSGAAPKNSSPSRS